MPTSEVELHRITWTENVATFHCDGDRTSPCHQFPDCECEAWSDSHEQQHPNVLHDDECWLLTWLDAIGADDCWEGDEEGMGVKPPRRDGPIVTAWNGESDCVLWDYADTKALRDV